MLKTVKELGMPFYEKNWMHGNLYINFQIIFPDKFEKSQIELLNKVLIAQTTLPIKEDTKEFYQLSDYNINDENTHYSGGKIERI